VSSRQRSIKRTTTAWTLVATLLGLLLVVGCGGESARRFAERRQIEGIWLHHQKAVSRALNGYYPDDEFDQARAFFGRLTGIEIRTDSLSSGDLVASPKAIEDLEQVREWYAQNNDRLYLDKSSGAVQVHGPLLSRVLALFAGDESTHRTVRSQQAREIWQRNEAVVVQAIQGHQEDDEFERAVAFFTDVTGIEIDVNIYTLGMLPGPRAEKDLQRIRTWYAANKDRLFFDQDTLAVKVSPS